MATFTNKLLVFPDGGPQTRASASDVVQVSLLDVLSTLSIGSTGSTGDRLSVGYTAANTATGVPFSVDFNVRSSAGSSDYGNINFNVGANRFIKTDGSLYVSKNAYIDGNLEVKGVIQSTSSINDTVYSRYQNLNQGYTSTTASSSGFTFNTKAINNYTVVGFNQSTSTITVYSTSALIGINTTDGTSNAIIQISGTQGISPNAELPDLSSLDANDGLFEVQSSSSAGNVYSIVIKSSPSYEFCSSALVDGNLNRARHVTLTPTVGASGATLLTFSNVTGAIVGQYVYGVGIPANTRVTAVDTNLNQVTISNATTSSVVGAVLVFSNLNNATQLSTVELGVLAISNNSTKFNNVAVGSLGYSWALGAATIDTIKNNFKATATLADITSNVKLQIAYNNGSTIDLAAGKSLRVRKPTAVLNDYSGVALGGNETLIGGNAIVSGAVGGVGSSNGFPQSVGGVMVLSDTGVWATTIALSTTLTTTTSDRRSVGVSSGFFFTANATSGAINQPEINFGSATTAFNNMYVAGAGVPNSSTANIYAVSSSNKITLTQSGGTTVNLTVAAGTTTYAFSSVPINGWMTSVTGSAGSTTISGMTFVGLTMTNNDSYYVSGIGITPGTVLSYDGTTYKLSSPLYQAASGIYYLSNHPSGGLPIVATVKGTDVPCLISDSVGTKTGVPVYVNPSDEAKGVVGTGGFTAGKRMIRLGYLASITAISSGLYFIHLDPDHIVDIN